MTEKEILTDPPQTPKGALGKINRLLREAQYGVSSIQKNEILNKRQTLQLRELSFLIEKAKHQSTYTYKYWDDEKEKEEEERLRKESRQEAEALGYPLCAYCGEPINPLDKKLSDGIVNGIERLVHASCERGVV